MTGRTGNTGFGSARARLAALLACAYALRLVLVFRGGEGFWPDESRFGSVRDAAAALVAGHWRSAGAEVFGHADHVLFRLVGLPPALIEAWSGTVNPMWEAAYLSLFSVGAILLIWAVARRAGANEDEALWAAFFAAAANCLLFYCRHLFPYDPSLFFMLLALWLGTGRRPLAVSAATGAVVGVGFLTYNGHWLLGAAVLILHVLFGGGGIRAAVMRAVVAGAALAAMIVLVIAIGRAFSPTLVSEYIAFSGTVKQGDFHLGYRVILGYLWTSEGLLALLWVAAFARFLAAPPPGAAPRAWEWFLGAMIIFGTQVFFSDVETKFVVQGRLVRAAVPFLCLGAGGGMAAIVEAAGRRRRWFPAAAAGAVAAVAAWNFSGPIRIVYPDDFIASARQIMRRESAHGFAFYKLLFAGSLWGQKLDVKQGNYEVLLRRPNPIQFRPYQFEGFSLAQRRDINSHDVSMRLVRIPLTRAGADVDWGAYPGPVKIDASFDPQYWGEREPLVETGATGAGDVILIRFDDPEHVSFGHDHWGSGLTASGPVPFDYTKRHEISIMDGALLPPDGSPVYRAKPGLRALRDQLVIVLDGQPVLASRTSFFDSDMSEFSMGTNTIGASTVEPAFTGTVYDISQTSIAKITEGTLVMAGPRIAGKRPPEWQGAVGPLRLRFTLLKGTGPQPLMSLTGPGSKDVVFVTREAAGTLRVGIDRVGAGSVASGPIPESAGYANVLDVCLGSLLPGPAAGIYSRVPRLGELRDQALIRLNGVTAVLERMPFSEVSPADIAVGANTVGSSTYPENFSGSILSVSPIGPENLPMTGTQLAALLENPDPRWEGYPGSLEVTLRLPRAAAGRSEPLITTGTKGADDMLYVEYLGDSQVRFGYAHTPYPPMVSDPVRVPADRRLRLLLSMGSLFPPKDAPILAEEPDLDSLRTFVHVGVNGTPVLHAYAEFAPADASSAQVGRNSTGNGASVERFSGLISGVARAPARAVFEDGHVPSALGRPGWGGYPGALHLRLRLQTRAKGATEPLVTTGLRGIGDVLFLEFLGNGMARIGQDHWGAPLLLSGAFALGGGPEHEVDVSLGSLYPAAGEPGASAAAAAGLKDRTLVIFDGRLVLDARQPSHPTRPEWIMAGMNLIGASTAPSFLSGEVLSVANAPLRAFGAAEEGSPGTAR